MEHVQANRDSGEAAQDTSAMPTFADLTQQCVDAYSDIAALDAVTAWKDALPPRDDGHRPRIFVANDMSLIVPGSLEGRYVYNQGTGRVEVVEDSTSVVLDDRYRVVADRAGFVVAMRLSNGILYPSLSYVYDRALRQLEHEEFGAAIEEDIVAA